MEFIDLNSLNVIYLFIVGFIGGLVSGFIGSGGAFVLTPAMMNLGVSGIMAVASNMCHKFPKSLVGAMKRHKFGQVDIKLGIVMGISAEAGVLVGAELMQHIREVFGKSGSNLYVSVVFVVVLAIVGGYVLRDAIKMMRSEDSEKEELTKIAKWVHSVHIPYTMMYFKSIGTEISVLFTIPLGFATGMLAATIAVGGFIGVPAMMYILGVPGLMASATELVIAFIMGMGGTMKYALSGLVDVRLAMIILAGSLFGIQLGAIGTTYVKPYMVKLVMGVIMIIVLFSRGTMIPAYLSDLSLINTLSPETISWMKMVSFVLLVIALTVGAVIVFSALIKGMLQHRRELAAGEADATHFSDSQVDSLTSVGRLERIMLVTDNSDFTEGATHEAIRMAKRCKSKLHIFSVLPEADYEIPVGQQHLLLEERRATVARLNEVQVHAEAEGVDCEILLGHGDAFAEIVDEAEYSKMDLIVMGRREKSDLARAMLGGTTAKVIGHTHCNVLVVPRGAKIEGKGIVLPVDGSRYSDAAATAVLTLTKQCPTPVTVASVARDEHQQTEARQRAERVQALLKQADVNANVYIGTGLADEMIAQVTQSTQSDLVVMGSHGHSGLDRLLLGSTSERVIGRVDCPVLVVKV